MVASPPAFLPELNPNTGDLAFLCAGHNPPILRRADGGIERLKSDNMPLGIELTEEYATGLTRLEPQDLLIIYSDGVTEAWNENSSAFGDAPRHDDITCMVVRRT